MHEYEANGNYYLPLKISSGDSFVYDTDENGYVKVRGGGAELIYLKEQMTTQYGNHLLIPSSIRADSEVIQQKIVAGLNKPTNPSGVFSWAPYVDPRGYGLTASKDKSIAAGKLIPLTSVPAGEQRDAVAKWVDANGMVPELSAYKNSVEGGFDPSIARNSMGLTGAISFLSESRSAGGRWEYGRRVMGNYLTALYYIKALEEDLDTYVEHVKASRQEILDEGKAENIGKYKMPITQDYAAVDYTDVVTQGIYHADGTSEDIFGLRKNSRFGMVPVFEKTRPFAYIIDGDYAMADTIAFRLSNLGIKMQKMTKETTLDVETYTITKMASLSSFGASCKVQNVTSQEISKKFPAGSYIIYMEQPLANYAVVTLEPMSMRSWSGKDVKNVDVRVGKEQPFYRYMKTEKIADAEEEEIVTLDFTNVFVYDIKPADLDTEAKVRKSTDVKAFVQCVTVYGEKQTGAFRAYLPSDGKTRAWYVAEAANGKYRKCSIAFDAAMNRDYIEISPTDLTEKGDGYYSFEMAVTPSVVQPDDGGSGGGCNAGVAGLMALLAMPALLIKRGKK